MTKLFEQVLVFVLFICSVCFEWLHLLLYCVVVLPTVLQMDSLPPLEEQILCGHFGGVVLEIRAQPPPDVVDRVIENLVPPQNLSSGEQRGTYPHPLHNMCAFDGKTFGVFPCRQSSFIGCVMTIPKVGLSA